MRFVLRKLGCCRATADDETSILEEEEEPENSIFESQTAATGAMQQPE